VASRGPYLFPIDGNHSRELLPLVCDLVMDVDAELFLALPVIETDDEPTRRSNRQQEGHRYAGRFVQEAERYCREATITKMVKTGEQRVDVLRDIVSTHDIATVITERTSGSAIESLTGTEAYDLPRYGEGCDIIFVTRFEERDPIESIVVPIARGPHAGLAIGTGLALARQNGASLDILHVDDPANADGRTSAEALLDTAQAFLEDYEDVRTVTQEASDVDRAIVEYTRPFDLTVLGAPREGLLQQFIFDTIPDEVGVNSTGTIFTTRRSGTHDSWLKRLL
jgi:nucleotide-binding universal stress UspA family protein